MLPAKLNSPEARAQHLAALLRRDPRLRAVAERAGPFALRNAYSGFSGLARIVTGQQVSVASARAIWARIEALPGALASRRSSLPPPATSTCSPPTTCRSR
jgi:DNA-3-methyladenine glycosylase II